jgi:hypothetical protein
MQHIRIFTDDFPAVKRLVQKGHVYSLKNYFSLRMWTWGWVIEIDLDLFHKIK